MAIEGKRIARNMGLLYFRMLLLMAVSLYTSRVLLVALGVVDFGLYNVVGGCVLMIGFLQGTMSTASARFITVALSSNDIQRMCKTFSNIFLVNLALAIFVILLAETIGLWFLLEKMNIPESRIDASLWVYQLSVASVALNIASVPFNAAIIAHERMGAFAYISIFDAFSKLAIVYLITISTFDRLVFYAFLVFIVHAIDIAIYNIYCIRKFQETKTKFEYDKIIVKEIFSFILWSSYGSFVSLGFTQGLNIILNIFFGPAVNAARSIAVQVQHAVVQFTNNFQTAINPQLMKLTAQQNFADSQKLLIASSKYSFFLLCALGIPVIVETPFILSAWLKEVPDYSIPFCRIMLVISIFSSLANPLRVVNQADGNIKKFQLYECTLLLLIMPISYMVLKVWELPILVFVVHLFIELAAQFIRILIVIPKIGMSFTSYLKNIYIKILPCFILTFLVAAFLDANLRLNTYLRLLTVVGLTEITLFVCVFFVGLDVTERRFLKNVAKNKILTQYRCN